MAKPPNIVVLTSHDSGRHFGCYGAGVETPNIDALAADGVRCTAMFAVAPICTPSRGALLTGQCPQRSGLMGLAGGPWMWEMRDPAAHLSHVARAAGYATHLFGHQHETDDVARLGFDALHTYLSPHDRDPANRAPAVARSFADFCSGRERSRPFYAQMGFFETHTPWAFGGAVADDPARVRVPTFANRDDDATRRQVAALQGAARQLDEAVGIVTAALRESGFEDDTLVLFNTDHGPELPRGKWTLLDGGLGIAFIVRWPAGGVRGGRTSDWLLSNADFVPTLAELTGLPTSHPLDGRSFAPALRGEAGAMPARDEVHALYVDVPQYAVRTRRYKLVRTFRGTRQEPPSVDDADRPRLVPAAQLFDLAHDPLELHDVAADSAYRETLTDMDGRLWRWLEAVGDPILRGPVPTPFYERAIGDYHRWRTSR